MTEDQPPRSETTLLPCPFCGSSHVIIDYYGSGVVCASCEEECCKVIGPEASNEREATEKWNRCKRD
jgi:hypothetical protein